MSQHNTIQVQDTIGGRLRACRLLANMSLQKLSNLCKPLKVSHHRLMQAERQMLFLTDAELDCIATTLQVPVSQIKENWRNDA